MQTGNWAQYMRQDDDYDVTVRINNPPGTTPTGIAVRYDMHRMKLDGVSYSDRIGVIAKTLNLKFKGELDPDDPSKSLLVSGIFNIPQIDYSDFLLQEDGSYLLQEDGTSRIKLHWFQIPQY